MDTAGRFAHLFIVIQRDHTDIGVSRERGRSTRVYQSLKQMRTCDFVKAECIGWCVRYMTGVIKTY